MTILETIVAQKRVEVARLGGGQPDVAAVRAARVTAGGARGFAAALRKPRRGDISLIAEVKQASPSAGRLVRDFDPVGIARGYEAAGATCLSVLTDESFFQGSLADLQAARAAVSLPVLRKDFIIDARQILEAARAGADAILLIVAILADTQLREFQTLALDAGLDVLVEVHDEAELERALAAGARLVGVNNRNLKTFTVDLGVTERLARRLDSVNGVLLVAESGIHTRADVLRVARAGARAILVGEALMRGADVAGKAAELLGVEG